MHRAAVCADARVGLCVLPGQSVEELIRAAQECLGLDAVNHYNICVCGPSGVGKSSFINGIRGLRASDPGAARVSTSAVVVFPRRRYFVQTPPPSPPPPAPATPILLVTQMLHTLYMVSLSVLCTGCMRLLSKARRSSMSRQ